MTVACTNCKWHHRTTFGARDLCGHPDARGFDRVHGEIYAVINEPWAETANTELLAKCDAEGWFTKRKFLGLF